MFVLCYSICSDVSFLFQNVVKGHQLDIFTHEADFFSSYTHINKKKNIGDKYFFFSGGITALFLSRWYLFFFFPADSGFVTSASNVPTPDSSMGITTFSPKHSGKKLTCQVVHQAWRECYLNQSQHLYVSPKLLSSFCAY